MDVPDHLDGIAQIRSEYDTKVYFAVQLVT